MTVNACGDCHAMEGHVADLRNPASDSLAAKHYKNRYIQTDQCYTCHSDYGMFGTVNAKLEGLGHVYHNTTGNYPKPIKIKKPVLESPMPLLPRRRGEFRRQARQGHDLDPDGRQGHQVPRLPRPRAHTGRGRRRSAKAGDAMSSSPAERAAVLRLRVAAIFTLIAVILSFALLIKETAYLFTTFMFLGPTLLVAAVVLLGWNVLEELREKKVL